MQLSTAAGKFEVTMVWSMHTQLRCRGLPPFGMGSGEGWSGRSIDASDS